MVSLNQSKKRGISVPIVAVLCGAVLIAGAAISSKTGFAVKDSNNVVEQDSHYINVEDTNKELNKLQLAIDYALEDTENVEYRINNGELINSLQEKISFAFIAAGYQGNEAKLIRNKNENGAGITGYLAVEKEYFKEFYKQLFNDEVNEVFLSEMYTERDGYLYGSTLGGLSLNEHTYKFNSLVVNGNSYTVIIDVLVGELGDDAYMEYVPASVTEYPKDLVSYSIKLSVTKNNELYTINSIVAYK